MDSADVATYQLCLFLFITYYVCGIHRQGALECVQGFIGETHINYINHVHTYYFKTASLAQLFLVDCFWHAF